MDLPEEMNVADYCDLLTDESFETFLRMIRAELAIKDGTPSPVPGHALPIETSDDIQIA